MKRRSLLSLLSFASATAALAGGAMPQALATGFSRGHVLVLLELRGGNDGLNTLIPFRDPAYRLMRPSLALNHTLPLTDTLALHPALAPILPLWQSKRLAFALGVGWSRPNRSHFKSADQWATGTLAGEGPGWIAAAFDRRGAAGPLVALDPSGCPSVEGGTALALQLSPAQLQHSEGLHLSSPLDTANPVLQQMLALEESGRREVKRLSQLLAPLPDSGDIPSGRLGQQVALALRLIATGACPPVLQMAQGGYDTHANQLVRHERALGELAHALAAFERGLQRIPQRPRVTLIATSEFGRRLRENSSRGTDHGSASIALLTGDQVPHPFVGVYPSLSQLDDRGDLIAGLSPDQLYRQVLSIAFNGSGVA